MRARLLVALLLVALSGCAAARVRDDQVVGFAIGHAKITRAADGAVTIQGGALSSNLAELLASAITAVGAYFGVGAL